MDLSNHIKTARTSIAEISLKLSEKAVSTLSVELLESAKNAAELAVKSASTSIPGAYPSLIDHIAVDSEQKGNGLTFKVTAKAIHKTDLNVEAMYGASVAGLTVYNKLKKLDVIAEMGAVRIVTNKGGQKSFKRMYTSNLTAAVVVCSDSISAGKKEDAAGKAIIEKLKRCDVKADHYEVIPDQKSIIAEKAVELSKDHHLLIYTGGTGLSLRDVTPEALRPLLEREIPGIEEAIRSYGQERVPFAMLSRSVAGTIGNCLVLALPGSTNGAKESMDAIFPHVLHLFKIFRGQRHD
ncbi:molybdopterin-binding protein [Galbibacter sp. EGI 63066]|uniref:molybdenum cofactor synthesis domain-containing protein n=1 Tax=Galbibacter sp. EGI 63066 TaxID=2993559 RepID=UPI002248D2D8|nr:molybdenum cofactor synthesis domain-containing protein [Galbibacter sp. EGI 63066]MCX2679201.1 molybdopterin-binding protein [Galbibacter sp. EGI 63066]